MSVVQICAVCGQEVRLATIDPAHPDPAAPKSFVYGTGWLHRPPGPADHHRPRFGNLAPVVVVPRARALELEDGEEEPVDPKAPVVVAQARFGGYELNNGATADWPQSPKSLVRTLLGLPGIQLRAQTATAQVVSASPDTRGEWVDLHSIGLSGKRGDRAFAAVWYYNAGNRNPAWKIESCMAWGANFETAPLSVTKVLDHLSKSS